MLNQALASYVLAFMVAQYPVEKHRFLKVSDEYTTARYEAIAADIADVALDPDEPPVFRTPGMPEVDGRMKTAVLVASIARWESGGYREDVDNLTKKGDGGRAVCLLQLHLWTGEVVVDRPSCLRAGLRHVRESYRQCHNLSGYTVGHCVDHEEEAERRVQMAKKWIEEHPFLILPNITPEPQTALLR